MTYDPRRWLSASALKMLGSCAEQYRIIKVEKIKPAPAAWTVRGIAVHAAIEEWERSNRYIDPVKFFEDTAWPEALARITSDFPDLDAWLRTPRVTSTSRDLELRKKESPDHISRYVDRALSEENDWRVWRPDGSPMVEVEFKLPFDNFWMVGWIDQVIEWWDGETYTVKDIKTGGEAAASGEDNRQLGIYRYAANRIWPGLEITHGSYHYTKLDRDSGLKDLRIYTEEYLVELFTTVDSQIKNKIFLPNPDREKCEKFCGVRKHCREWKGLHD